MLEMEPWAQRAKSTDVLNFHFHFEFFGAPWDDDELSTISTSEIQHERINLQRRLLEEELARLREQEEALNRERLNQRRQELEELAEDLAGEREDINRER